MWLLALGPRRLADAIRQRPLHGMGSGMLIGNCSAGYRHFASNTFDAERPR